VKSALLALVVALTTLAACDAVVVDLGRAQPDAAPDATPDAANPCRCRIMSCRDAGDCTAIGGACGGDQWCVGALEPPCTMDSECRLLDPNAVCTAASDSTLACP